MEFKLINPQDENGFIKNIDFNFEELKTELANRLEKYENLTYSEEQIKDAKDDRAGLNKFKEAIETRRKEIKNLCLQPYNDFEKKVKELTGLIDKPILAIDTQLKKFEDQRISTKRSEITDFYNSSIGDLKDILPLERIFNEKWLNATFKMSNIQKEMIETIGKVSGNIKVIEDLKLDPDMELQVKDKYINTLDFGLAMSEKTRLENLKQAFKAREMIQEEQIDQPEPEPVKNNTETTAELENNHIDQAGEMVQEKICVLKFWARGTKEQLLGIREYMKQNNIEYGGIQ